MERTIKLTVATIVILSLSVPRDSTSSRAADYPPPQVGDYVIRDFHFASGETLPELRLRYRTLGTPARDGQGVVRNAVLIMHGTTGEGETFCVRNLAGSSSARGSSSTRRAIISFCPTGSVTGVRVGRARACTLVFPIMATATWWRPTIGC